MRPAPRGMQANGLLRVRTPLPGPELDLIEAALMSHFYAGSVPPILFREPELPTGSPDIVAVFPRRKHLVCPSARLRLGVDHLRLLHHVYTVRRTSVPEMAGALMRKESRLLSLLDDLAKAHLVRYSAGHVMAESLTEVFVAKRIVAVEAKIGKWNSALRQAVANTWFASHSYILLPAIPPTAPVRESARRFGVGVMTYDGTRTSIRLRARPRRIPASYGSWLLNELMLREAGRLTG